MSHVDPLNSYPDGTEIENFDSVTIQTTGIVYRRLLWSFDELLNSFEHRINRLEATREDMFTRLRELFPNSTDAEVRVMTDSNMEEMVNSIRFIESYAREGLRELTSPLTVTVNKE